jgi:enolase-phosphatase E1
MTFSLSAAGIRGILLDIEGTTTPLAFVHEVLFPYAREHVKNYLTEHFSSTEVQTDLLLLSEEHAADLAQGHLPPALAGEPVNASIDSAVAYVYWLMERDRKATGLKSLQGKIWQQGYRVGTLKSQVFEDVPAALKRWQEAKRLTSIFSSGSMLAQRLLFAHTETGDLTGFIASYFDTGTGPKTAPESYRRIARTLPLPLSQILFISDIAGELDAAITAGMCTSLCERPGNHPQPSDNRHQTIKSFDEITN